MTYYAGAARHLFVLTAIASCANNISSPSFAFVAAAAESSDPTLLGSNVVGWHPELNWDELTSKLSPLAALTLIDTSFTDYKKQCIPEFYKDSPTNHALIDQPSGMCLSSLLLGWEPRSWMSQVPNPYVPKKPLDTVMSFEGEEDTTPSPVAGDDSILRLNLPYKVVFPSNASDVLHIIEFAKKHKLEISVKNSGHSYSGASSKRNTLLINMNQYTQYAPGGITDCDEVLMGAAVADDLSDQACLLALARGKPGLIRVGGGENYDKVYRAVIAENQAQDEYKYHLTGGSAGTVSPMGWTFQGGNAPMAGGRMYGMGVDQVLQVEMVLPNGYHVKFGPTEWEDASAEGFVVPRTTSVSGVCRSNPDEQDEEKWMWTACPEDFDIDFGDLWFAVNGGGGGTWGVVTSVSLQLHDILPYNQFKFFLSEKCSAIVPTYEEFVATYFMKPSLLNVTKEESLACSSPNFPPLFACYGDEDVMQAWMNFLKLNNFNSTDYAACLEHAVDSSSDESPKSFPEFEIPDDGRFPGKVPDVPASALFTVPPGSAYVLIPLSWIDEIEESIDTLLKYSNYGFLSDVYYAYGVATYSFSDQANSLPQTAREAAVMAGGLSTNDDFWSDLFPKMYDISDKANFPAVFQSNHAGPSVHGPLKDDWTKGCPLEWTFEERKEKCISAQEAIYGTELLRRLEAIKMKVDPEFIFNCNDCVGNNLDVTKAPEDEAEVPLDEPSSVAVDEPSGASYVSTSAAAISATVFYMFFCLF